MAEAGPNELPPLAISIADSKATEESRRPLAVLGRAAATGLAAALVLLGIAVLSAVPSSRAHVRLGRWYAGGDGGRGGLVRGHEKIRELHARGGWPSFFSKLAWDESPVTVAFLGGSVTRKPDCWRPQVMELLRSRYPAVAFKEVNAAVGGTGSLFGAFRVEQDVIQHRPDLVFIEFAANDRTLEATALATAEGIVRQLRRRLPRTDIAIVHVTSEALAPGYDLRTGALPEIVQVYERLADHYGIPSIHLGLEVVRRARAGGVIWRVDATDALENSSKGIYIFGTDGVHPRKETGCAAYARAVARALPTLEARSSSPSHRGAGKGQQEGLDNDEERRLPAPLTPDNLEGARLLAPQHAALAAGVHGLTPTEAVAITHENGTDITRAYATRGYLAQKPGQTFTLSFHGSQVGILLGVGPFSGDLVVRLDDEPPKPVPVFDTFCFFPRLGYYRLVEGLAEANHTLVVDVAPAVPPKRDIMARKQRTVAAEFLDRTDVIVLGFGVA